MKALDKDEKTLIQQLVGVTIETVARQWPESKEPTVHKKDKKKKSIRAIYDTKLKKYTNLVGDEYLPVPKKEVIKIELGNTSQYYCYHPDYK